MKEWDAESYSRKFANTLAVFKNEDGEIVEGYVSVISSVQAEVFSGTVDNPNARTIKMKTWEPQYVHVPAGFYSPSCLIQRKNRKVFTVGLNTTSHSFLRYNPRLDMFDASMEGGAWQWERPSKLLDMSWLTPKHKEEALKMYGAISRHLFLSKTGVFYRAIRLGSRVGSTFHLLDRYKHIHQEISDALREVV